MQCDFEGITNGTITTHQAFGYIATKSAIELITSSYKKYSLSTIGHSLGAWLANLR